MKQQAAGFVRQLEEGLDLVLLNGHVRINIRELVASGLHASVTCERYCGGYWVKYCILWVKYIGLKCVFLLCRQ